MIPNAIHDRQYSTLIGNSHSKVSFFSLVFVSLQHFNCSQNAKLPDNKTFMEILFTSEAVLQIKNLFFPLLKIWIAGNEIVVFNHVLLKHQLIRINSLLFVF